jgi:hypothetical protein
VFTARGPVAAIVISRVTGLSSSRPTGELT